MIRWLTIGVPLALAVAVVLTLGRGLQAPSPGSVVAATEELPRYSVKGAQWVRLDSTGQPELRAKAATLDYYSDESVRMTRMTLDMLGGVTSPWTMTAPAGQVPPRERSVLLTGDVVANGRYADEPIRFTTESLWVDLLRRELRTDDSVVLESDYRRASARGLRADFSGSSVRLLNDVQVEYVPEG